MKYIAYKTANHTNSKVKKDLPSNYITEWRALTEVELDNLAQMAEEGWQFLFENKFNELLAATNTDENLQQNLDTIAAENAEKNALAEAAFNAKQTELEIAKAAKMAEFEEFLAWKASQGL